MDRTTPIPQPTVERDSRDPDPSGGVRVTEAADPKEDSEDPDFSEAWKAWRQARYQEFIDWPEDGMSIDVDRTQFLEEVEIFKSLLLLKLFSLGRAERWCRDHPGQLFRRLKLELYVEFE